MSRCVRNGVSYKRHKIDRDGVCKGCGAISIPSELREAATKYAVAQIVAALNRDGDFVREHGAIQVNR